MGIQEAGGLQEGVAVHHAVPGIGGILQAGNHAEDTLLLREFQSGLEAYNIEQGSLLVILPQLDNRKGFFSCPGIFQPNRLHGTKGKHHPTTACHGFNRHAAFEHLGFLEAVHFGSFCRQQSIHKGIVFFFRHGAVEIIISPVIPGLTEDLIHVQGFQRYDRRSCIIEMQRAQTGKCCNGISQRIRR